MTGAKKQYQILSAKKHKARYDLCNDRQKHVRPATKILSASIPGNGLQNESITIHVQVMVLVNVLVQQTRFVRQPGLL